MNPDCFYRQTLADMVPAGGQVIELGVASGAFSEALLRRNPNIGCLRCVDKWDDHHTTDEMIATENRLRAIQKRPGQFVIYHMTFEQAVPYFADASQDLIYVDGYAHTGQDGGKTLRDWWPKVKPGGIFAGHDYDAAWPLTKIAVDEFVASVGIVRPSIIVGDTYASWWVMKPFA